MKLSEDLLETWAAMIDEGTGGFDIFKIIENAAKEAEQLESRISALESDTAPLSREELETVLKEAGWVANSKYIRQFNCPNHTGWIDIEQDCEKPMFHFASVTVPLSAVTRRLLRDCGVIA